MGNNPIKQQQTHPGLASLENKNHGVKLKLKGGQGKSLGSKRRDGIYGIKTLQGVQDPTGTAGLSSPRFQNFL